MSSTLIIAPALSNYRVELNKMDDPGISTSVVKRIEAGRLTSPQ